MRRALETGSEFPEVHAQAAMVLTVSGEWRQVEAELVRAVELGMSPAEVSGFRTFRVGLGRADQLVELWRSSIAYDPLNPASSFWVAAVFDAAGDAEGALTEYERGRTLFDESWVGHFNAFTTLLGIGEHERARELAQTLLGNSVVAEVLPDFDSSEAAVTTLRGMYESDAYRDLASRQTISILAAYFGDEALSLRAMRDSLNEFGVSPYLWRPVFSAVRRHEDFKDLARDFGFVDYWQEYGWPESCRPLGSEDFECS